VPLNRKSSNSSTKKNEPENLKEINKINTNNIKEEKIKDNFQIEIPKYTFDDIIVSNEVKSQLQDIIYSKIYRKKVFDEWGLGKVIPLNNNKLFVNLYGPPGTGKTMAAHVIAKELKRNLLCVNYSEIESKYVGETSKNLEKVFKFAKENDLILFFDEADAMLSKRVTNMNNSTDVSVNQTRSVLLMLMNNYDDMVIFATNFINNMDEAFVRRIQFQIKFEMPNKEVRELLWNKYIPKEMPNNANIIELAEVYENISGSDICNAVMTAAFKAARLNEDYVDNKYFHDAINRIIKSKKENKNIKETKTERFVSEDYVKKQIKIEKEGI